MSHVITVTLACGCTQEVAADASEPPVCQEHQEHRVQAVRAPNPRVTGTCTSPLKR